MSVRKSGSSSSRNTAEDVENSSCSSSSAASSVRSCSAGSHISSFSDKEEVLQSAGSVASSRGSHKGLAPAQDNQNHSRQHIIMSLSAFPHAADGAQNSNAQPAFLFQNNQQQQRQPLLRTHCDEDSSAEMPMHISHLPPTSPSSMSLGSDSRDTMWIQQQQQQQQQDGCYGSSRKLPPSWATQARGGSNNNDNGYAEDNSTQGDQEDLDDSHSVKSKRIYAQQQHMMPAAAAVPVVDMRLASTYVPAVAGLLRSSLLTLLISR